MTQLQRLDFFNRLNGLTDREYLLSVIAYGAAPTLLSNKPSTMLNFQNGIRDLYALWHQYKQDVCSTLGLDFFELNEGEGSIGVLFFNESILKACLAKSHNRLFLNLMGYGRCLSVNDCLLMLRARFLNGCPHEIGLFLGFPVQDVIGFIRNKGRNCLLCQYWKVYSHPEKAKQIFSAYDEARSAVINTIKELIAQ